MLSMHPRVDLACDPSGEAGHGLQFFERGVQKRFGGAEVGEYLLLALGADTGEVVEDGGGHGSSTKLAVVGVREAVRLVADALEQVQLWGVALKDHGLGTARLEDLLVAFGEGAHGDVR